MKKIKDLIFLNRHLFNRYRFWLTFLIYFGYNFTTENVSTFTHMSFLVISLYFVKYLREKQ